MREFNENSIYSIGNFSVVYCECEFFFIITNYLLIVYYMYMNK